jgi:hypothetical protein
VEKLTCEEVDWLLAFTETFDVDEYGWYANHYEDDEGNQFRYIKDGKFQIYYENLVDDWRGYFFGIHSVPQLTDFLVSVEAQSAEGTGDTRYGVVFRETPDEDFYIFQINDSTQQYALTYTTRSPAKVTFLVEWTDSSQIKPGKINKLGVKAVGSELSLYINNQLVDTVESNSSEKGYIGVQIGLNGIDKSGFYFDNVKVFIPPDDE